MHHPLKAGLPQRAQEETTKLLSVNILITARVSMVTAADMPMDTKIQKATAQFVKSLVMCLDHLGNPVLQNRFNYICTKLYLKLF